METCTTREVLDGISALLGAEPVTAGSPDHVSFVANAGRHFKRGWQHDFWPELMLTEQRAYRDAWVAGIYPAGSEVIFGDKYWTNPAAAAAIDVPGADGLLVDEFGVPYDDEDGDPYTDETSGAWVEATRLAVYVAYEQTGQTPIGTVEAVYRKDPRVYGRRKAGEITFERSEQGIVPDGRAGVRVWIHFRRRVPALTAAAWAAGTTYRKNAPVYDDATGECYQSLQAGNIGHAVTDAAWWAKVDFPAFLKAFVETACYADALRGDGQTGKALAEQGNAETFLLLAYDDAFPGQGQYSSASYSKN